MLSLLQETGPVSKSTLHGFWFGKKEVLQPVFALGVQLHGGESVIVISVQYSAV